MAGCKIEVSSTLGVVRYVNDQVNRIETLDKDEIRRALERSANQSVLEVGDQRIVLAHEFMFTMECELDPTESEWGGVLLYRASKGSGTRELIRRIELRQQGGEGIDGMRIVSTKNGYVYKILDVAGLGSTDDEGWVNFSSQEAQLVLLMEAGFLGVRGDYWGGFLIRPEEEKTV